MVVCGKIVSMFKLYIIVFEERTLRYGEVLAIENLADLLLPRTASSPPYHPAHFGDKYIKGRYLKPVTI
jgi:hypothetical protein